MSQRKKQISDPVTKEQITTDFGLLQPFNPNLIKATNINVGKKTLFTDTTNSRVGINIPTPHYELDIKGSLHVTGDIMFGYLFNRRYFTPDVVGNTPNSFGMTLVNKILKLQPCDSANPGVLSVTNQDIAGNKTFIDNVRLSYNTILASKPLQTDATGNVIAQNIDLTSQISGVLKVENGGTNSSVPLTTNKFIVSSGGAMVEGGPCPVKNYVKITDALIGLSVDESPITYSVDTYANTNTVTLFVTSSVATQVTSSNPAVFKTPLPTALRPARINYAPVLILDNSTQLTSIGLAIIDVNGVITVNGGLNTVSWSVGSFSTIQRSTISYTLE